MLNKTTDTIPLKLALTNERGVHKMSTRTCSYLLGNKGCHSYNGNPSSPRELVFDEKTQALVEEHVHKSVGHITVPPWSGTGFRVGTNYLMSAYHVFKHQIRKILEQINYFIPKSKTIREIEEILGVERNPEAKKDIVISLLETHLVKHGTNIKLLLDQLDNLIPTKPIAEYLSEVWRPCFVEFSEEGRFYLDWDIKFGDEKHDIIVVKLKNENIQEVPFPPALLMDYKHRPEEDIQIVRYKIEDVSDPNNPTKKIPKKEIIISTSCELFCKNFKQVRQNCIDWWKNYERIIEEIDETIDIQGHFEWECPSQYDENTGQVITQASQSFKGGSSGSPMMYVNSTVRQPVVTSVFQGGLPTFYYAKIENNMTWMKDEDVKESGKYLFEKGLSVAKICELLDAYGKDKLKENILTPLKQVEEKFSNYSGRREPTKVLKMSAQIDKSSEHSASHPIKRYIMTRTVEAWEKEDKTCFVTKGVKETMERIESNDCLCVCGDPGSGKSMSIRHAALQLRSKQGFTIYPISSPDEFFQYLHLEKYQSQVFVIDDILGIHSVYKNLIDQWSKYHDVIKSLLSKKTKILASLRTHLVQHQNIRLEDFVFLEKSKRVDFYDERYRLGNEEMKDMLRWRLNNCNVDNADEIIGKIWGMSGNFELGPRVSDSFPLLCNMFCRNDKFRNDPKKFFSDPFQTLIKTFRNMRYENRPLFCGLVLCVAFDGQLSGDNLSTFVQYHEGLKDDVVKLRDSLMKSLRLDPLSDLDSVKTSLTTNDGIYVRRIGNDYEISHRIFQDIVTFVYDDKYFLFKFGTSQFIKDRVRLKKRPDDDQFVVVCGGNSNIDRLATRLTNDFKKALPDKPKSDQEIIDSQAASSKVENPNMVIDEDKSTKLTNDLKTSSTDNSNSDEELKSLQAASFIVENPNIDDDKLIGRLKDADLDDEAVSILFKQCFIVLQKNYKNLTQSSDGDKVIPHLKLISLLLDLGADCNMSIGLGSGSNMHMEHPWPLHISVNAGSMQLTRLLIDKGADMRICDLQGRSVLHLACSKFHKMPFVRFFIQKGIDKAPAVRLLAVAKPKKCIWLAKWLHPESVQLEEVSPDGSKKVLTKNFSDVRHEVDNYSGNNRLQVVEILHKSCLNAVIASSEQNALHLAVSKGSASDVGELLALGANLNNRDKHGLTPKSLLDGDEGMDERESKTDLFKKFGVYD